MEFTEKFLAKEVTPLTVRGADLVVNALVEAGVDVVFGIPGGTIAPIYDALLDHPGVRVVTMRHENLAMFAAAAWARATGKVGVVLVTSGPGVINAMTGLASAWCDGAPVLLLAGEVARGNRGRHALQDGSAHHLNILGMTGHVSKLAVEVPDAQAIPVLLRRALATALSGRRGPVTLTLPIDVSSAPARPTAVALDVSTRFDVEPHLVKEVGRLLVAAERPLLFVGAGVRGGDGPAKLRALVDHFGVPVMTTPKGKGVLPEDHPLSLGVHGLGGHPSATDYVADSVDVLVAIGTSLGELQTNGWSKSLAPSRAFVHVDIDAQQIGRNYPTDVAIAAPADLFLDALTRHLPRRLRATHGVRRVKDAAEVDAAAMQRRVISPGRALWELQRVMPRDTIFTVDSGEHFLFAVHYLETREPDAFLSMSGLGSMGSGIGGGIGAKLADPRRGVAVICGDGGFAMSGTEVSTAVQAGLPIVFCVLNDQRLGMVERGHGALYGRAPQFATDPLHIPEMAQSLGADAIVIERPGELLALEPVMRRMRRPLVLDVRIDPEERLPKNGRFEALGNATKRKAPAAKLRSVN